ncbi:asparagine synthase (glutamine-hydrolyzing) [Paralimibaculum aggregatum]|uniref:asparagine synthase (glutamine-hydrolyzing) n=1 Tax=Paralimibaculum aggregatum TaxID=3036245 RepID=A0ABQ6LIS7_9RHOB|nr:asparagine synthase (glutamine-hydrolyzing) [Limibaculum sp. NKW23]GMG81088.1 asparagine synthase (glutamine-hydrolyzing) [Limibaculum sp. NKW23]
MCGIAGSLGPGIAAEALGRRLAAMSAAIAHRGPDADGHWADPEAGIGLAHTRLAIQDLSAAGAQPMVSACGRWVISYNGEVFSGAALRAALPGHAWRGHSDTEALLESIAARGLEATLAGAVGQFAFALWDRRARELTLVRDRLGIKPLYWTARAGGLLFASELGALMAAMPRPEIDPEALAAYLRLGYVPAPRSIYAGVQKLAPGQVLRIRAGGPPRITPFYDLAAELEGIGAGERIADPAEAEAEIEARLSEAVRIRLISDVPLGAFLSGGIDSTLITALMQEASPRPVRSFSIGNPRAEYDEARHARAVAARLGTEHTELEVGEAEALAVVPGLMAVYGEPFGDSSGLPTLLLSKLARAHVTVALSGDGGDELFAGYNRYRWFARLAHIGPVPGWLRRAAGGALTRLPPALVDRAGRAAGLAGAGRRVHKLAAMLGASTPEAALEAAVTQWRELAPAPELMARPAPAGLDPVGRMQAMDLAAYLPDDILTKVDRASMAHALEVRVPFLDHRVVRAAFRLAPELKLRGGRTKWILRQMLEKRVPRALVERPKQGFAIPVERWLGGQLRPWAEALLAETDWEGRFGLAPGPIRAAWEAHLAGRADHGDRLWTVLMLAAWAEGPGAGSAVAAAPLADTAG